MADTFQFQCQSCGHIAERPQNPRTCPSCGEAVMRPAELSEPGDKVNSFKTEDFDVDSALSELEGMKSSRSEDTTETTSNEEDQEENRQPSQPDSSEDPDNDGLLSRLKSLF